MKKQEFDLADYDSVKVGDLSAAYRIALLQNGEKLHGNKKVFMCKGSGNFHVIETRVSRRGNDVQYMSLPLDILDISKDGKNEQN